MLSIYKRSFHNFVRLFMFSETYCNKTANKNGKKRINKTHKYYLLAIDPIGILNRNIVIGPEFHRVIPRSNTVVGQLVRGG